MQGLKRQVLLGGSASFGLQPRLGLNFLSRSYGVADNVYSFSQLITFTRSTTATRINESGLIESVAINGPRFDYDPVTRAPRGLLVEEQRTNLLLRSEEFDNASWGKSNATVTANAATSPDGTVDADKLVENTASAQHFTFQSATKAASAITYTATVYLKASERSRVRIFLHDGAGNGPDADANLSLGTIGSAVNRGTGWTGVSSAISDAGSGWYRCTVVGTSNTATSVELRLTLLDGSGNASYTGDGTSGIFIWGAQLEAGAFATSYIPTVASQVTRSADVAAINAPNFASWFNANEGTLVSEFSCFATATPTRPVAEINDGTVNNRYLFGVNPGSTARFLTFIGGSAVVTTLDYTAPAVGAVAKWAGAYRAGNYGASLNAAAALTSTYGSVPTGLNALLIGSIAASGGFLNGHIRSIRYYPTRLSNAQLQALTA